MAISLPFVIIGPLLIMAFLQGSRKTTASHHSKEDQPPLAITINRNRGKREESTINKFPVNHSYELVFIPYDVYTGLNFDYYDYENALTKAITSRNDAYKKFKNPKVYFVLDAQSLLTSGGTQLLLNQVNFASSEKIKQLGLILDINDCVERIFLVRDWNNISAKLDFILFKATGNVNTLMCDKEAAFGCILGKIHNCQRKFFSFRSTLEIIYETDWSPQELDKLSYITALTTLRHLAITQNITVLLNTIPTPNDKNRIQGWTEMGKNVVTNMAFYCSSLPPQTLRHRRPETKPNTDPEDRSCKASLTLDESSLEHVTTQFSEEIGDVSFDRTHFGVRFYPKFTPTDGESSYDVTDLLPFVSLIGSKFRNILLHAFRETYRSNICVPEAVAEINKNNTKTINPSGQLINVYLEVDVEKSSSRSNRPPTMHRFEYTKSIADSANRIFEGTVQYLLLNAKTLHSYNADWILSWIEAALKTQKPGNISNYQIGATLKISHCTGKHPLENHHVKSLLQKIYFVVFEELFTAEDVKQGVPTFFKNLTADFNQCLTNVHQIAPNISVGFLTSWPDRDTHGEKNTGAMVWLWKKLNDWAVKKDVVMFLDSAFDEPTDPFRKHTGWWKFVKDKHCYSSTKEYSFLEKDEQLEVEIENHTMDDETSIDNSEEHIVKFIRRKKYYPVEFRHLKEDPTDIYGLHRIFNTSNFGVLFHPYVIKDTEADMKFFLDLLRTRFSHVIMTTVTQNTVKQLESILYIPRVAAKLNRDLNSPYIKPPEELLKSLTKPLEISIPFRFDIAEDKNIWHQAFEGAKGLADEANGIHPKTVKYLLIDFNHSTTDSSRWFAAKQEVINFRGKVQRTFSQSTKRLSYQLGVTLNSDVCNDDFLWNMTVKHIIPHVQFILLSYKTTLEVLENEWNEAFQNLTKKFEVCTEKIKVRFPKYTVGLLSQWRDSEKSVTEISHGLIDYWQVMNQYSMEKSIPVFISEAFDNEHDSNNGGWWRIIKNSDRYIIQEKYQVIYKSTRCEVQRSVLPLKNFTTEKDEKHETTNSGNFTTEKDGKQMTSSDFPTKGGEAVMISSNDSTTGKEEGSLTTTLQDSMQSGVYIISIVGLIIITASVGLAVIFFRKFRRDAVTKLQRPTTEEIMEFFEKRKHFETVNVGTEVINGINDGSYIAMTSPLGNFVYDHTLELQKDQFMLDAVTKVRTGFCGGVCKGRIFIQGKEISVAVKRVNSLENNKGGLENLRSLLYEIKVLSYLGRHENIVALLGAHTSNITEGEVYGFFELCPHGSLEKCLKTLRNSARSTTSDDYKKLPDFFYEVNTLAMWSLDIVQGMEFLASKHVCHADLSTRSVQLAENGLAKICDFEQPDGMINKYKSCINAQWEPQSWQWMSPEALNLSIYDEKSDVWAFGVTLWEIYTHCDDPYAGMSWNVDFAYLLNDGLQLPAPKYGMEPTFGDSNAYSVMLLCWEIDPSKRPTFRQLKDFLITGN